MKKIFVSFDFTKDKHYKYLLTAMSKNAKFMVSFEDNSSKEINSSNIGAIKSALSRKIQEADYLLFIVGEDANRKHRDSNAIGYKNWQIFELEKAKALNKKIIGVKISSTNESPEELKGIGAKWAMSYTEDSINNAINGI